VSPPTPPRLPDRLLRWVLPGGLEGQAIRGDLLEEFHERVPTDGVGRARAWYRREALALAAGHLRRRLALLAPPFGHDIRLAVRSLARQPALTTAIVLTLGLAIGANTALFSVFDGLLFRPLPYRDADRIVHLQLDRNATSSRTPAQLNEVLERVRGTASLVERADSGRTSLFDRTGAAVLEWQLRPYDLSVSAFELLGIRPMLGRPFTEADSTNAPFSVLLGYDVWQTRFGGDPDIVDRIVEIPGTSTRDRWHVIGVMPQGFSFPEGANFWIPVYPFYATPQVLPYARLAAGVSVEAVRAELPGIVVTPLREHVRPAGAFALAALVIASALLLLVAWVQVAALLVARAAGRVTEIGVRLAIGATRWRLVRQFAIEGAAFVVIALGIAAAAAPMLTSLVAAMLPPDMTIGQHVAPDLRAFGFGAGLSAAGLLLFAILPADLVRRASPLGLLRGAVAGQLGHRATRVRRALFMAQLAMAAALLYLAGLTLGSFSRLGAAPLGFDPADLVAIKMPRGDGPVRGDTGESRAQLDRQRQMVTDTIGGLRQLPAVLRVSGSHSWPHQIDGLNPGPVVAQSDSAQTPIRGQYSYIMPGYADVLGVRLTSGAEPEPGALAGVSFPPAVQLALVNETLARRLSAFGPVVGQVVSRNRSLKYRVTGVLQDVNLQRADQPIEPTVFVYLPPPAVVGVALIRLRPGVTSDEAGVPVVLDRIWGRHAPRPLLVRDAVRQATADFRARAQLLGLMSFLCLPLTMIGVAGAVLYAISQRRREIAIRLALGADASTIRRDIARGTLVSAGAATAMGLAAGIGLGRAMSSHLFGLGAADPATIAAASTVLLLVVWLSTILPARRAGRVDPASLLRDG
jgi:predicted permease